MEHARAFVIVIDACGVGALPDAAAYGDEGTNTLAHVADAVGGLELPALQALGLGSILPLLGVPAASDPVIYGRLHPLGPGKDSATGHWELMGAVLERALPTYPHGFPPEAIERLEQAMGRAVICNEPYNGIAAIDDFGSEHLRTGALILYTSQDSVLQLAAHVERAPREELYRACMAAREVMRGEQAVATAGMAARPPGPHRQPTARRSRRSARTCICGGSNTLARASSLTRSAWSRTTGAEVQATERPCATGCRYLAGPGNAPKSPLKRL